MNFKEYLAESQKVYKYRIKTASPLTTELVAQIAAYLAKFRLISISKPTRSILQKNPLDFYDLQNVEVYMIDIETSLPCSSYILQQDIRNIMNIPEKYVVVRGENEPIEVEANRLAQERDLEGQADKGDLERAALLSTDPTYTDAEQTADGQNYYGNDYNNRLLSYLKTLQAEHQPAQVDAPAPLFAWMDMPKPDPAGPDFNQDIKMPAAKKQDSNAKEQAPTGNFDNSNEVVRHTYLTKGGKDVVKSAKQTTRKG